MITYKVSCLDDLHRIASYYALKMLPGEALAQIASDLLEIGMNSESTRILAGETNSTLAEHDFLFKKMLGEHDITIPPKVEALSNIALYYANQIVAGKILPYEGAVRIWRDIYYVNSDKMYDRFVGLASEYEDFSDLSHVAYYGSDHCKKVKSEIEKKIIKSARALLEQTSMRAPELL